MSTIEMEDIIDKFTSLTQKPVNYLTAQPGIKDDIKNLVKSVYGFTKSEERREKKVKKNSLPELIIEDFDEEQIWQQIELQNTECWDQLVWEVANCMSNKNDLSFPVETSRSKDESSDDDSESDEKEQPSDDESDIEKDEEKISKKSTKSTGKIKSSIVDDKFFKLQEMEKFLLNEEKEKGKADTDSEEEPIDMFEEMDDDESGEEEGGKDMMYYDFFEGQEGDQMNNVQDDDMNEDDDDMNDEDGEIEDEIDDKKDGKTEKKSNTKDKKVTFADESSNDESDNDSNEEAKLTNGENVSI
jgi:U3 small nucleolar RNA-associated protein MPP10